MIKIPTVGRCPYCGKDVELRNVKMRTPNENKYYWAVPVRILSEEIGLMPMEIHEMLKNRFLKEIRFVERKDKRLEVELTKSTASLTTEEFEEFLRNVRVWSSMELGVFIPLPNEELKEL